MRNENPRAALARLVEERNDSFAALSRMLGHNVAYLQQYVRRETPKTLAERDRRILARYFGVAESVLGGPDSPDLAPVPRLDVSASAGPGAVVGREEPVMMERFDRSLLRAMNVRPEAASMIRVRGDSMRPTLSDGDDILVDGDDRDVGKVPGLFVVRHGGDLLVKRVSVHEDKILIESDNPAYPRIVAGMDEVDPVGRVVWMGRMLRHA